MEQKPCLSVVFLGHRHCGKSTLAGRLISMKRNYPELSGIDKDSDKDMETPPLTFIVDMLPEEREKGHTISFSLTGLESAKYEYAICNVPGRRDLLENMIRGTSQADAAVLVVSSLPEEFEVGVSKEGQTIWHPIIAYTFGIKQFIVCITKIDDEESNFSEAWYNEIKKEVSLHLKKAGISPDKTPFIPVSGVTGENLLEKSESLDWYKGPTLIEAMDNFAVPKDFSDRPLRIPVQQVKKVGGVGTVPMGKIQSGTMKPYIIAQITSGVSSEVKSIQSFNKKPLSEARSGTNIGFNVKGVSVKDLGPGDVVGDAKNNPPRKCIEFIAQVIILNHPTQIKEGYTPIISIHTASVACRFEEMLEKLDRATDKRETELDKFLKNGECRLVRMKPLKDLCVETFQEFPRLGRFLITDMSKVIGVGIVKSVVYESKGLQKPQNSSFFSLIKDSPFLKNQKF